MSRTSQSNQTWWRGLAGAGLTVVATWIFLAPPLFQALQNVSYDLPFAFRPDLSVAEDDVVIVYMDNDSHRELNQDSAQLWDRKLHAQLVERLTAAQARVIAFDVVFRNADTNDPAADTALLGAARAHGKVLFAAETGPERLPSGQAIGLAVHRPFRGLADEQRFPCLKNLECLGLIEGGFERTIRAHYAGTRHLGTLAWKCAQWTLADPPRDPAWPRWMNYYRSAESVPHVAYARAWAGAVPSLVFSNKIVFIGSSATVGPTAGTGQDRMRTPYGTLVPGVDIQATTCLNLLRDDWLRGLSPRTEWVLFTLMAVLAGYGLAVVRPARAAALALGVVAGMVLLNFLLFWKARGWFVWMLPCAVQIPSALFWSILAHTRRLAREKAVLEQVVAAEGWAPASDPTRTPSQTQPPAGLQGGVSIPDHSLIRPIGRGAYGEVWLARNVVGLHRAVKLVYRHAFDSATPYEREFRGLEHYMPVSLNHPGLLRILHAGRNDAAGYFFSIMELADDEVSGPLIIPDTYQPSNLARIISRRGRIPAAECVEIFCALAEALDFLHHQGLIHRDIKPSNIVMVNGVPKLADIGLVTSVGRESQPVTQVGTAGFMAPEGPGTPAADIYSLGKVLYEACMGRDRELFPEFATTWLERPDRTLLVELNTILGKACLADPRLRYGSAAHMQADLARLRQRILRPGHGGATP